MSHPEANSRSTEDRPPEAAALGRSIVPPRRRALETTGQLLRSLEVRVNLLRARGVPLPPVDLARAYAHHLVMRGLSLLPAPDHETGYDARDCAGIRYRVAGHRDGAGPPRVVVPGIPYRRFDRIVVVRFGTGYGIRNAPMISTEPFLRHAHYSEDANEWSLSLDHDLWESPAVADLTDLLRTTAAESAPEDALPAIDPFIGPAPYPDRGRESELVPPRA